MPVLSKLQTLSDAWITDLNLCANVSHIFKIVLDIDDFGDRDTGDQMTKVMHDIMFNLGIVDYDTIYCGHLLRKVLALLKWASTLTTPASYVAMNNVMSAAILISGQEEGVNPQDLISHDLRVATHKFYYGSNADDRISKALDMPMYSGDSGHTAWFIWKEQAEAIFWLMRLYQCLSDPIHAQLHLKQNSLIFGMLIIALAKHNQRSLFIMVDLAINSNGHQA